MRKKTFWNDSADKRLSARQREIIFLQSCFVAIYTRSAEVWKFWWRASSNCLLLKCLVGFFLGPVDFLRVLEQNLLEFPWHFFTLFWNDPLHFQNFNWYFKFVRLILSQKTDVWNSFPLILNFWTLPLDFEGFKPAFEDFTHNLKRNFIWL